MFTQQKQRIETEILEILKNSPVPEDYRHALNVLAWVRRFKPDADIALQIAALAHDIERALPDKKVHRSEFQDYDEFKQSHAKNSARIVRELLTKYEIDQQIVERICYLIRNHEFGTKDDEDLIVLKDADSLSFFEVNLPHYYKREGKEETYRRMYWGFLRLSEKAKSFLRNINYKENVLNDYLAELFRKDQN